MNPKHFIINSIASSPLFNYDQRRSLLGLTADTYIGDSCYFTQPDLSNIEWGDRTFVNSHCYIDNAAPITIGDDTCIAPFVRLLTTTHEKGTRERRSGYGCKTMPIVIGRGCWIGAGVTILPGVTIGDGVIIGAGALVRSDCGDDGLYVGVPARRVKELTDEDDSLTTANKSPCMIAGA